MDTAKRRHVIVSLSIVAVCAAFIGLLAYGLTLNQSKVPPANIDKEAKPFRVAWVQGHEILPTAPEANFTLADFKGKPLVLNFWASWCVACREEAHELQKFWEQNKGQVMVVGIAIQDEKEAALKFAQYYGKTYILGLDQDGNAAIDYGVSGVPETFLIDRNGIIRHKEIGPVDVDLLKRNLPKIL